MIRRVTTVGELQEILDGVPDDAVLSFDLGMYNLGTADVYPLSEILIIDPIETEHE